VAPGNPMLGVMMPNTPLHHLLLRDLNLPVVTTSGNVSDEPMCIGDVEAHEDLHGIADCFLTHDREIVRRVDDSIVRMLGGNDVVLRRARGYAPYPLTFRSTHPGPDCLAVGGHLKNAIALTRNEDVFLSQHIGDLDSLKAVQAHEETTDDLQQLLGLEPQVVARDLHPDYISSHVATRSGLPTVRVQHHHAHVVACMADNDLDEPVLGVAWDGTGYGTDHTIWGGEFLQVNEEGFERLACLRPFKLFGGESTVKQPRRMALSLLYQLLGAERTLKTNCATLRAFDVQERQMLLDLWQKMPDAPVTSSVGRLFDVVSSLLGLCQINDYEGQAAMMLEWAIRPSGTRVPYHLPLVEGESVRCQQLDWEPLVLEVLADISNGEHREVISKRFHDALAVAISAVAVSHAIPAVVLTGGCFQNEYLSEQTRLELRNAGFRAYSHQRIPPGDGGLAVGQAIIGRRMAYSGGN
ncbi:MAG: carbamoyltransferase HypF, partial [Candidatus Latescibacteria bacterium]|nr:carbamoyltransferase HypF [Candidatus Latescibacterota bacterium]